MVADNFYVIGGIYAERKAKRKELKLPHKSSLCSNERLYYNTSYSEVQI